jgi:hypothetical protein
MLFAGKSLVTLAQGVVLIKNIKLFHFVTNGGAK